MRVYGKWYGVFTVAIVMLIGLAFILTNVPAIEQVIAQSSCLPYYRSEHDSVCLITVFDGDMDQLLRVARRAASAHVPVTVGITVEQLNASPDLVKEVLALGHALALYGRPRVEGQSKEPWRESSILDLSEYKGATGYRDADVLYIPYLGQNTTEASEFCRENGMICLLYCKDSRVYPAESPAKFAQLLAKNAQEGDFIYVSIDGDTDFEAIYEAFSQRRLTLDSVTNALRD